MFIFLLLPVNMSADASDKDSKDRDKSKDIKLLYSLANTYFETRNYERAVQYYDSVISYQSREISTVILPKGNCIHESSKV